MICGFCKSDIEADSFFCDQCGSELLICEKCGKAGKGKRCIEDGGKLLTAKEIKQAKQNSPQNINLSNLNNSTNAQPQQVNPALPFTPQQNMQRNLPNQQPNVAQPYVNTNVNAKMSDNTFINNAQTISSMNIKTVTNVSGPANIEIPQLVLINKAMNATVTINENDII